MTNRFVLLFYTLRYLKPIQFYWRIYLKIIRLVPFPANVDVSVKTKRLNILPSIAKHESFSKDRFSFLNESKTCALPIKWNAAEMSKLWLYNLHYFDFLNQERIDGTVALDLMTDWIRHNKVGDGNGWESYPLSLRIVNWIKFLDRKSIGWDRQGNDSVNDKVYPEIFRSLYLQARYLRRHLEYHLLGNHLIKNSVALIFAGAYFNGDEAAQWLEKGKRILLDQLKEQVLYDGGHFERSPMYHAIILEDFLDCINILNAASSLTARQYQCIEDKTKGMLGLLKEICHPDGEIPFFNDSAIGIASFPAELYAYASRVGIPCGSETQNNADIPVIVAKPEFGLFILRAQDSLMIIDAGKIGPDYLPGHAHCDTLSYEFSIGAKRCIVNSGTFQYAGAFRNDFRSTKAHNTVCIDDEEQHEIWSTFRVARRGIPIDINYRVNSDGKITFGAGHTGYRRLAGAPGHRRKILVKDSTWTVSDAIEGSGTHFAESFIHLHPRVSLLGVTDNKVELSCEGTRFDIHVAGKSVKLAVEQGWYSDHFGSRTNNHCLVVRTRGACPFSLEYSITVIT